MTRAAPPLMMACALLACALSACARSTTHFADAHNSVLRRLYDGDGPAALAEPGHPVHLEALSATHTRLMVFSLGIARFDLQTRHTHSLDDVLTFFQDFRHHADAHFAHQLAFWDSPTDAPTRWVFSLEGAHLLHGATPDQRAALYDAGLRIVAVAHSFHGPFLAPGPSTLDRPPGPSRLADDSTLTPAGQELVTQLQQEGFMLDVSHLRQRAFWQVLDLHDGRSPLIASHSGYRPLCDNDRNLNDAQLKAIVATGGVVAVPFHAPMLSCAREATAQDVAEHIAAMVKVVGPQGVAVGSDLEGRIKVAQGLERLEAIHNLQAALREQGLSDESVSKIMGENLWRVMGHLGR